MIGLFMIKNQSNITASLDRTNSYKGYLKNNVKWVHKTVNKMKQNLSEEEFIYFCKLVTDYDNK